MAAALETPRESETSAVAKNNWQGWGLVGAAMRGIGGSLVRRVHCEQVDYSSPNSRGGIQRANPDQLRAIFNQYASVEEKGVKMMTADDFIRKSVFFSYLFYVSFLCAVYECFYVIR